MNEQFDVETGLFNRDYLFYRIAAELAFAARHQVPFGILLLSFEAWSEPSALSADQLGKVATRLRGMMRKEDVLGRWFDATFAILLRNIDPPAIRQLAERLCALLGKRGRPDESPGRLRVSVGMATVSASDGPASAGTLLDDAEAALALARAGGGGRVKACTRA